MEAALPTGRPRAPPPRLLVRSADRHQGCYLFPQTAPPSTDLSFVSPTLATCPPLFSALACAFLKSLPLLHHQHSRNGIHYSKPWRCHGARAAGREGREAPRRSPWQPPPPHRSHQARGLLGPVSWAWDYPPNSFSSQSTRTWRCSLSIISSYIHSTNMMKHLLYPRKWRGESS